ncbi:hypothetical protein EUGRSUZ_C01423 [Eucalyptus grandis]|uniref:Uncharacterized protein n=2 Tax=Eucalyptus grandis TaxID=71139 RepID=A0A059CPI1_EUCGR|nr:hypothetical protein EUGRSUZ_C01423 [Eucalyptus grandis]
MNLLLLFFFIFVTMDNLSINPLITFIVKFSLSSHNNHFYIAQLLVSILVNKNIYLILYQHLLNMDYHVT